MSAWAERLAAATGRWHQGDLDGAAAELREIVVSGDQAVIPEASHVLGLVLQDKDDHEGATAAHRAVIATGDPVFGQRSAISLGMLLVDREQWALAYRPLRIAAGGADTETAVMADMALVHVLGRLGDRDGAAASLERARRTGNRDVAEMADKLGEVRRWPQDDGEREREAWEAFQGVRALLDEHGDSAEATSPTVAQALNMMLAQGIPELTTAAAFRLYPIYADDGAFEECRRVMEHAIAVGDPAERGMCEKLLGAALYDLDEPREALEAYRRAAEDHRPEIRLDALIQQSKFERELGADEEAVALLWRVVESGHPEFALEARACLGQVYSEEGELDRALECWRVVLDADTEFRRGAVHFLGVLLHDSAGDDAGRDEIRALLARATEIDDPDLAFQAQMILAQAQLAERGSDEEYEQAIDDCDAALELIRSDDVAAARALLRQVIDSDVAEQSVRAAKMLAMLELEEGDFEQAEELIEDLVEDGDFAGGFGSAVELHLFTSLRETGERHPVLTGLIEYQRHGRETGIARYQEAAEHPDPAVSGLAKSMLGQVYSYLGVPRSQAVDLLEQAAASGDPFALSHAAVMSWIIRGEEETDAIIGLLRRAHVFGHPILAPWVGRALGTQLEQRAEDGDLDEAVSAYEAVAGLGNQRIRDDAEADLARIFEEREDLESMAALHERALARREPVRSGRNAWLLGLTRVRMDELAAAREAFAQVPEDHPELAADGAYARGLLDRDFEAAGAHLAEVTGRGEPDHRDAMCTMLALESAHAWQRARETAAADRSLSLALRYGHPQERRQEAAIFLGALRNDAGDLRGALEAWSAGPGTSDDPSLTRLLNLRLGWAKAETGDLDGSIEAHRRALALTDSDDEQGEILGVLVEQLVRTGRVTEARSLMEEHTGDGPQVALTIATTLEQRGDTDAAAGFYREVIEREPREDLDIEAAGYAFAGLAKLHADRGQVTQAADLVSSGIARFEMLADAGNDDVLDEIATASYDLAGYLERIGDAEGARQAYERAAQAADPDVWLPAKEALGTATAQERGWHRLREDDTEGALVLFTEEYGAADLARLHVALYEGQIATVRGLLARLAGGPDIERGGTMTVTAACDRLRARTEGATELYELVLEFGTPELKAMVCDEFAGLYEAAGELDAAVEAARPGGDLDAPAVYRALRRLPGLLYQRDDLTGAEEYARRAVRTGDPQTEAMGWKTLGDLAVARDDQAGAVTAYRRALDTGWAEAEPYVRVDLGRAQYALGEAEGALRTMESVLGCGIPEQVMLAGIFLGAWLAEQERLAGAVEALGRAVVAGPEASGQGGGAATGGHGDKVREYHEMALRNLGVAAGQAEEAGEHDVAVRALHLAAQGGAYDGAVERAREYAQDAEERGDWETVRTYYKGAAAFPPGDPHLLIELADTLAARDRREAMALLEPLASSDDASVRLSATAQLLPLLQQEGEDDRALEIAARAAGHNLPPEHTSPAPTASPAPASLDPATTPAPSSDPTAPSDPASFDPAASDPAGSSDPADPAGSSDLAASSDPNGAESATAEAVSGETTTAGEIATREAPAEVAVAEVAVAEAADEAATADAEVDGDAAAADDSDDTDANAAAEAAATDAASDVVASDADATDVADAAVADAADAVAEDDVVADGGRDAGANAEAADVDAEGIPEVAPEADADAGAVDVDASADDDAPDDAPGDVAATTTATATTTTDAVEADPVADAADPVADAAEPAPDAVEADPDPAADDADADDADADDGGDVGGGGRGWLAELAAVVPGRDSERVRGLLAGLGDPEDRAAACELLIDAAAPMLDEDPSWSREVLELAASFGGPDAAARAYGLLGDALRDRAAQAEGAVRPAEDPTPAEEARDRIAAARDLYERGERLAAREDLRRLIDEAEPSVVVEAANYLGAWLADDADWQAAVDTFGQAALADLGPEPDHDCLEWVEFAVGNLMTVAERAFAAGAHQAALAALESAWRAGDAEALTHARDYRQRSAESGDLAAAAHYDTTAARLASTAPAATGDGTSEDPTPTTTRNEPGDPDGIETEDAADVEAAARMTDAESGAAAGVTPAEGEAAAGRTRAESGAAVGVTPADGEAVAGMRPAAGVTPAGGGDLPEPSQREIDEAYALLEKGDPAAAREAFAACYGSAEMGELVVTLSTEPEPDVRGLLETLAGTPHRHDACNHLLMAGGSRREQDQPYARELFELAAEFGDAGQRAEARIAEAHRLHEAGDLTASLEVYAEVTRMTDVPKESRELAASNVVALAVTAAESGEHEAALRGLPAAAAAGRFGDAAFAGWHAALLRTAEADVANAHAYYDTVLGLTPEDEIDSELQDEVRGSQTVLPRPRPELDPLYSALRQGESGDIAPILDTLRDTPAASDAAQTLVGVARARGADDKASARALLSLAAESAPAEQAVAAWEELAELAEEDGDTDAEIAAYERAAAVDGPAGQTAMRTLVRVLYGHDRLDDAAAAAQRAAASEDVETAAFGHRFLGRVALRREDPGAAVTAFRTAIDRYTEACGAADRRTLEVGLSLSQALQEAGDGEGALVEALRVEDSATEPKQLAKARSYVGNAAYLGGDLERALHAFGEVAKAEPADDEIFADLVATAKNNVMAILIEIGERGDARVVTGGIGLAARLGLGEGDPLQVAMLVARAVGEDDPAAARAFLEAMRPEDPDFYADAIAGLSKPESEDPAGHDTTGGAADAAGTGGDVGRNGDDEVGDVDAGDGQDLEARAWALAESGEDAAAKAVFAELYGSPLLGELPVALLKEDVGPVRGLLERAAGTEHLDEAATHVLAAGRARADRDLPGARELLSLAAEYGAAGDSARALCALAGLHTAAGEPALALVRLELACGLEAGTAEDAEDLAEELTTVAERALELALAAASAGDHATARRGFGVQARAGAVHEAAEAAGRTGTGLFATGRFAAARDYYTTALELVPQNATELRRTLDDALRRLPEELPELAELYAALRDEHDPAAVRPVLERLAGSEAAGPAGRAVIAVGRARGGDDVPGTRTLLEPVTEFCPPEQAATAWDDIGDLAEGPERIEAYERGAAIDHPASYLPLRSLAQARLEAEEYDAARAAAERAIATADPETSAFGHRVLGRAALEEGDPGAAADHFRRGVAALTTPASEPDGAEGSEEADRSDATDRSDRAEGSEEADRSGATDRSDGAEGSGENAAEPGAAEEAAGSEENAAEPGMAGSGEVALMRLDLARALHEQGETEAAKAEAEAVRSTAHDPEVVLRADFYLGNFMVLAGDHAGALEAYGRVALSDDAARVGTAQAGAEHVETARNNVLGIAGAAYEAGDHVLAVRALVMGAEAGNDAYAGGTALVWGRELAEAGETEAARRYFQAVPDMSAKPDVIRDAIAELRNLESAPPPAPATTPTDTPEPDPADPAESVFGGTDRLGGGPAADAGSAESVFGGTDRLGGGGSPAGPVGPESAETESGDPPFSGSDRLGDPGPADAEPAESVFGGTDRLGGGGPAAGAEPDESVFGGTDRLGGDGGEPGLSPELEAILDAHPESGDEESPPILPVVRDVMRSAAGTDTIAEESERTRRQAQLITHADPEGAIRLFELITEYGDPAQAAVAWDDIGDVRCYDLDDPAGAIAAYRAGAAIDDPAALLPLRSLLLMLGDEEEYDAVAEEAQRAVISGDPETVAVGYWTWGGSRLRRGDTDGAVRLYRQGLEAGHEDVGSRINIDLARTLRDRGETEEARTVLEANAQAPDLWIRARSRSYIGEWAYEDGDLATAAEAFGQVGTMVAEGDDEEKLGRLIDMAAHNVIVVANNAYESGEHTLAARALTLAARAGRQDEAVRVAGKRAAALAEAGDGRAAAGYMECVVGLVTDPEPQLELDLAELFRHGGEPERAREILRRLTEHDDTEIRLLAQARLASLAAATGDADGLESVSRAMTEESGETGLDPRAPGLISSMLGILQSEQGDAEAALGTFRSAAESGEPVAMFMLALELDKKGDVAGARELYVKVVEAGDVLATRAMVQYGNSFHEEDPAEARLWYMRALEAAGTAESGNDAIARVLAKMYLGSLAKRVRDWPEALRWYQQVIDSGGQTGDTSQAPMAAAHLGELAYWMNDRDNTVRFYELTLAMGTKEPELIGEASYRLGEIAHREGDIEAARDHLRRAVESGWEGFVSDGQALLDRIDGGDSSRDR